MTTFSGFFCVLRQNDSRATFSSAPLTWWSLLARSFLDETTHRARWTFRRPIRPCSQSVLLTSMFPSSLEAFSLRSWASDGPISAGKGKIEAQEELCDETRVMKFRQSLNLLTRAREACCCGPFLCGAGSRGFGLRAGLIQSQFASRSQHGENSAATV